LDPIHKFLLRYFEPDRDFEAEQHRLFVQLPPGTIRGFRSAYARLAKSCDRLTSSFLFHNCVFAAIIGVALVAAVQTDASVNEDERATRAFSFLEDAFLGVFAFEVIVMIVAEGLQPLHYFHTGWNVFDFTIVAVSFLPTGDSGGNIVIFRMLRLFRVLKMLRSIDALDVVLQGLLGGLASCPAIGVILFLVYYIFAVAGVTLFASNDPWHFGSLHVAMVSGPQVQTVQIVL
jgi:voltage-gated sodium channel